MEENDLLNLGLYTPDSIFEVWNKKENIFRIKYKRDINIIEYCFGTYLIE